ncbi:unnamed protein product [Arabidopsis halleri]
MDMPTDLMKTEDTQKVSVSHDWSKLCPDLLRKIIESLSSLDFYRAKIVCSDWYSVWKTCVKRPLRPWRIIYEEKYTYCPSMMLFDPDEEKIYRELAGVSDKSYCLASSGNWLLMADSRLDFYIVNLLTGKRINLPPMESKIRGAQVRFELSRECSHWGYLLIDRRCMFIVEKEIFQSKRSAVLWINERTGDYFVAWIFNKHYLFTHKKGDDSWCWHRKWTKAGYLDLAYKNNKLYIYTTDNYIKIFDFSGDFLKEEIKNNPYRNRPFNYNRGVGEIIWERRIAIQKSGEVLIILRVKAEHYSCSFWIFKMNLESRKWERVDSIGDDEMIIFGHGATIRAPVQDVGDGVKSGSIWFVKFDHRPFRGVFDLATGKITTPKFCGYQSYIIPTTPFITCDSDGHRVGVRNLDVLSDAELQVSSRLEQQVNNISPATCVKVTE